MAGDNVLLFAGMHPHLMHGIFGFFFLLICIGRRTVFIALAFQPQAAFLFQAWRDLPTFIFYLFSSLGGDQVKLAMMYKPDRPCSCAWCDGFWIHRKGAGLCCGG